MAAGDLIADDYEVEYNGNVVGAQYGHELVTTDLLTAPGMRTGDKTRSQDHGTFPGDDYYSGKTFNLVWEVWADTNAEMKSRVDTLLKMCTRVDQAYPLVLQSPVYGKQLINCKARRHAGPIYDKEFDLLKATVTAEYYADDPRVYDAEQQQAVLQLAAATQNGLTFNAVGPIVFGGISESGSANIINDGTFETRPVIDIAGPVTNPTLENLTTGKILRFNGTVEAGQLLIVDFNDRSVLLDYTSNRYSWVDDSTQWWTLEPGSNTIRFAGSTVSVPQANVVWRSARV